MVENVQNHIIARDAIVAYGDDAKGFALERLQRCLARQDWPMEAFWASVMSAICDMDPSTGSDCPLEVAGRIKLH